MTTTTTKDTSAEAGRTRRPSQSTETTSQRRGHPDGGTTFPTTLRSRRASIPGRPSASGRHVRVQLPKRVRSRASPSIYLGSYRSSPRHSLSSLGETVRPSTPRHSPPPSTRNSIGHDHLEPLLQNIDVDLETYGVEEFRDGFFDASFFKAPKLDMEDLMETAAQTLPDVFLRHHPLSVTKFFPHQWRGLLIVARQVLTTRAGIKLMKSFIGVFIAYILCLIPAARGWLGPFSYVMVISTIINHPGRSIGAQLDGTLLTTVGTAIGLGYGAFALWVSASAPWSQEGFGGILAIFLFFFMAIIAALRSYFNRLYQLVIAAGLALIFTCLADSSPTVYWRKLYDYGIPWLFGQAIGLLVSCVLFPDTSARSLADSLHNAFQVMQETLELPNESRLRLHRRLAFTSVKLSQAYRDLALDLSITRFDPADIVALRNLMQAVVRSLLSLSDRMPIMDEFERLRAAPNQVVIDVDEPTVPLERTWTNEQGIKAVVDMFGQITLDLLEGMQSGLAACDAALMDLSRYRSSLGPPVSVSSDVTASLTQLRQAKVSFDEQADKLHSDDSFTPSNDAEVVESFLFVNRIRLAAASVEPLLVKVREMQQHPRNMKVYLPSYPITKAMQRTNAQVRHDRGGATAGYFFHSQKQLLKIINKQLLHSSTYKPMPREIFDPHAEADIHQAFTTEGTVKKRLGYKIWQLFHHLQGFETRFALKVSVSASLLAIPAWLPQSRGWWNANDSWWAVIVVWLMMHPRVGGNLQDLVTRTFCGVLGAVWGGLAYGAGDGSPYVMAVFAAIFMIPMLYRFTQSVHPRSGIVGCVSFTVVSLSEATLDGRPSVATVAWTRGVAITVGIVTAVLVNWGLWPFVARHELRKALAHHIVHLAVLYRRVVAKYLYYVPGEEPSMEDIEQSEIIEGRLREGFVRIRQLMALTRHEIRLRGPFNALPYSALIAACENFFERLIEIRQASLVFDPHSLADSDLAAEALVGYRRDAVGSILMNLYVLAGALRGDRKVPRYLPSAALARKRLLDRMDEVSRLAQPDTTGAAASGRTQRRHRATKKWASVYMYSYSTSLTDCVEQLEVLQNYTKAICGEQGFDPLDINVMWRDD